MSTRKLLASAAAAVLMAGGASALTVTQGDTGTTGPLSADTISFPLAGQYHGPRVIAEEATLAASGATTGLFEFTIGATGTFAASENYFVDVTISGGTFSQNLTGNEVVNGNTSVTGSSVQASPPGGAAGDTTVRFLVSTGVVVGNSIGLELPITLNGCNSLTVQVAVRTSGGVIFEEGTASLAAPAVVCGNAYQASISTDIVGAANDSVLASSAFTNYLVGTTAPGVDPTASGVPAAGVADTSTVGTHGVLAVSYNPDALTLTATNGAGNDGFLTNLNTGATITGAAGELTSADFNVNVADTTGISGASFRAAPGTLSLFTAGVAAMSDAVINGVTFTGTSNPYLENILLTVTGGAQITQQAVTTSGGTLEFNVAALVANEPIADATIDNLNFEGVTCGVFDWVGDASKPTQNIFRVTGHGPATTSVVATISNSSDGVNGSATLTQAYDFTGAEVIVNTTHLTNDLGNWGRGDLLLNFIGAQQSLDCDRLMNSDAANIITAFGNNNTNTYASDTGSPIVVTTSTDGDD